MIVAARILSRGDGKSSGFDRFEQLGNRFVEIDILAGRAQESLEYGDFGAANRIMRGIRELAQEGAELHGRRVADV